LELHRLPVNACIAFQPLKETFSGAKLRAKPVNTPIHSAIESSLLSSVSVGKHLSARNADHRPYRCEMPLNPLETPIFKRRLASKRIESTAQRHRKLQHPRPCHGRTNAEQGPNQTPEVANVPRVEQRRSRWQATRPEKRRVGVGFNETLQRIFPRFRRQLSMSSIRKKIIYPRILIFLLSPVSLFISLILTYVNRTSFNFSLNCLVY
jgi:hypothetical protein